MSDLQVFLFGILWVLFALLIGSFIKGILFRGQKYFKAGLLLILLSYFLGLTILGVAITHI